MAPAPARASVDDRASRRASPRAACSVVTFDFPYMAARPERAGPAAGARGRVAGGLERASRPGASGPVFAGGKSMGGRIASQVARAGRLRSGARRPRLLRLPAASARQAGAAPRRAPAGDHGADAASFTARAIRSDRRMKCASWWRAARRRRSSSSTAAITRSCEPKRADLEGESVDHAIDVAARWMTTLQPAPGGRAKLIRPLVAAGKSHDLVWHLLRAPEPPRRPAPSPACTSRRFRRRR